MRAAAFGRNRFSALPVSVWPSQAGMRQLRIGACLLEGLLHFKGIGAGSMLSLGSGMLGNARQAS